MGETEFNTGMDAIGNENGRNEDVGGGMKMPCDIDSDEEPQEDTMPEGTKREGEHAIPVSELQGEARADSEHDKAAGGEEETKKKKRFEKMNEEIIRKVVREEMLEKMKQIVEEAVDSKLKNFFTKKEESDLSTLVDELCNELDGAETKEEEVEMKRLLNMVKELLRALVRGNKEEARKKTSRIVEEAGNAGQKQRDLENDLAAEQEKRKELGRECFKSKTEMSELQEKLQAENKINMEAKKKLQNEQADKMRLKEELKQERMARSGLQSGLDGEKARSAKLKNDLQKEAERREGLQHQLASEQNRGRQLDERIMQMQHQLASEQNRGRQLDERIMQMQNQLASEQNRGRQLDERIMQMQNQLASEQNKGRQLDEMLQVEQDRSASLQRKMAQGRAEVADSARAYTDIYKLMIKCASMDAVIREDMKLSGEEELSVPETFIFVNTFGREFTFARLVYRELKKYKESHKAPLSEDELALIRAVNEFYHTRYPDDFQSFDALDCLGIGGEKEVSFDRRLMKDLNNPRNTEILHVQKLYVPALRMMNGKDIEEKAIITG